MAEPSSGQRELLPHAHETGPSGSRAPQPGDGAYLLNPRPSSFHNGHNNRNAHGNVHSSARGRGNGSTSAGGNNARGKGKGRTLVVLNSEEAAASLRGEPGASRHNRSSFNPRGSSGGNPPRPQGDIERPNGRIVDSNDKEEPRSNSHKGPEGDINHSRSGQPGRIDRPGDASAAKRKEGIVDSRQNDNDKDKQEGSSLDQSPKLHSNHGLKSWDGNSRDLSDGGFNGPQRPHTNVGPCPRGLPRQQSGSRYGSRPPPNNGKQNHNSPARLGFISHGGFEDGHAHGPSRQSPSNGSRSNVSSSIVGESVRLMRPSRHQPTRPPRNELRGTKAPPSESMQRTLDAIRIPQVQQAAPMDAGAAPFVPGAAILVSEFDRNVSSPSGQNSQEDASSSSSKKGKQQSAKEKRSGQNGAQPGQSVGRRTAFEQSTKLTSRNADGKILKPGKMEKPTQGVVRVEKHKEENMESDDLVTRLTKGLKGRPTVECPICFNVIGASNHIWCCLPPDRPPEPSTGMTLDLNPITGSTSTSSHYSACYTPFHLNCIKDWADRSLTEEQSRVLDGLKEPSDIMWRCPGCQKKRKDSPREYRCFCGRLSYPASLASAPHSCGDSCSRKRIQCEHPCPLPCHPGPCPPCKVALVVPCPSHNIPITVQCGSASSNNAALSPVCDDVCGKVMSCGHSEHVCQELCHYGPCQPCTMSEVVRCYCGEHQRDVECGWNRSQIKICTGLIGERMEETWEGRYNCGKACERLYDCGIHACHETCHPHSATPLPCPFSPDIITHCPCGASPLVDLPDFPRPSCVAPIPTCGNRCPIPSPCGHPCPRNCHSGECPPCHEEVVRTCRCGQSQLLVACDVLREKKAIGESEVTCERVCKSLRNCGRHECGRLCCPLWEQAKVKNRRLRNEDANLYPDDDLHKCHLVCGKMLSCGHHTCQKPDHKGSCGRCLQASYDELICHCGHTVIYPPVACGTQINCLFPCARPIPSCGHPKIPHQCHEDANCPPCPYLTSKSCACGKESEVKNVRCSADRVSCGQACGELLACGFHRCQKLCHRPGECDSCSQVCNKPKSICKHPCTATCHAPAKCPENDHCQTSVTQTCACGNLQSRTSCGASNANQKSRELEQLKCNSECAVRQRNARLADALGIKPGERNQEVYADEWKSFAAGNIKFVKMVENTFEEFFKGPRTSLILPHMPLAKRTFVLALAEHYHLTRELIDQEPNRSIQIRRRIDTRIPKPLLSSIVNPPSTTPQPRLATTLPSAAWIRPGNSGETAASIVASRSGYRTPTTGVALASSSTAISANPSRVVTPVTVPVVPVHSERYTSDPVMSEQAPIDRDTKGDVNNASDDWDVDLD